MDVPHTGHPKRLLSHRFAGMRKTKARMANAIEYRPGATAAAIINPKAARNAASVASNALVRSVIRT
jgi:hypothetical protein